MSMETGIVVSLDELLQLSLLAKKVNFLPNKKINSILSGRHGSKLRGRGMDFLELKTYVQGDDPNNIDWRATRRSNKTYVKVFNEERDRTVHIVLSQQSNMFFGSQGSFKSVQAARLAATVLYSVLHSGDRVGAVLFNDEEVLQFKASKSKKNATQFLKEIVRLNQRLPLRQEQPDPKMLNRALERLMPQLKHDDLVIVIGDGSGLDDESQAKLTHIAQHNDIIGTLVYDPLERELPDLGSLLFRNSSQFVEVNSSDTAFRKQYEMNYRNKLEHFSNIALMHKIPLLEIRTDQDLMVQLQRQLGVR